MSFDQVMEAILELSHIHGVYGRLYESIQNLSDEEFAYFRADIEGQKFEDILDVILYFDDYID